MAFNPTITASIMVVKQQFAVHFLLFSSHRVPYMKALDVHVVWYLYCRRATFLLADQKGLTNSQCCHMLCKLPS
jgi:hypothetical protein